ncbi:MAG: TonB-dependent receptor [Acidobacteriota bacterium]|nr:TonB-dependent receptor [Acidobacteriota bacterium]
MKTPNEQRELYNILKAVLLLSAIFVMTIQTTFAQAAQSELNGIVTDANGAAIAFVKVILTEIAAGQTSETRTGADGTFAFTNKKPGIYSIKFTAANFNTLIRERVTLTTGERIRIDQQLEIAAGQETITINADAPLLRSETGSLGQVIDNRKVVDLPLNGRSFFSLVGLAAGVTAPPRTTEGASLPRINGGRPRTNEYLFDGISVLQPEPGQVAFSPIIDAIQEFKVEVNTPPAEFGRFNGGIVNLTTKAGTNDLHGAIFEFFRNEKLNARNLFAPATTANLNKPVYRRHQFGGVVGGSIIKDKTFFFADYQGTQQLIGRVRTSTVPTLVQRSGNFASSLGALLYRTSAGAVTTTATGNTPITVTDTNGNQIQVRQNQIFRPSDKSAYAGNLIPASDFDTTARLLLARFPLPTTIGAANNYTRIANETQNQDQFDFRIDHNLSDSGRIFGRYSFARDFSDPVAPLPDGSGAIANGAIGTTDTNANALVLNYTQTFAADKINELRFGYTARKVKRRSTAPIGTDTAVLRGLPAAAQFTDTLPTYAIAGFQQLGSAPNTVTDFSTNVTEIYDAVSFVKNRNSFKFGGDFRREHLNVIQPPSPTGNYVFSSVLSNSQGAIGTPSGLASITGNALASFLLGQVQTFTVDLQPNEIRPRSKFLELFAQNDVRVNSRLTLNFGVRYTLNFPSTEKDNQAAVFNLNTQQLDFAGQNGNSKAARELHKLNFAPRLGLAYRVTDKTVIRTGYGVVWIEQAGITTPFTTPFFPFIQTVTQRTLNNIAPAFQLSNGATVQPIPTTANAGLGQGVFAVDRDLGSGYVQQWNIGIQRAVTNNLVFEIAYAGSKITHVGIPDVNINQLTAAQLARGSSLLTLVPNPCFGRVPASSSIGGATVSLAQTLKPFPCYTTVALYRNNVGNTNYNALQAKIEQRFSNNLSFLVAYTRSKLIDEASSVFDATVQTGPIANFPVADSFNRRLERDVSTGDLPNVFAASVVYDLPHRKNQNGVVGKLLNGWSLNGIVNAQSGVPVAVTQATNFNAFAGFGTQRPNLTRNPNLPSSSQTTAQWFDISAFTTAPQFTIGSSSRNPVRAPHYRNIDFSIIKRTNLTETTKLELRAEIFNLTNTPPLNSPNTSFGSAAFGTITAAGDPRVIQLAAKFNF